MQCPRCKLEMHLQRRFFEGKKQVSVYICRDKRCEGSKEPVIKEKEIKT